MVVSEMGEQWSPHTAPAMQAETHMTPMGSVMGNTSSVMGISMPKVPQLVPVAKLRKQPIRNTMAGRKDWKLWAELFTAEATYAPAPRESVIALRDQAQVSISIAGTMALKPSGSMPIIYWQHKVYYTAVSIGLSCFGGSIRVFAGEEVAILSVKLAFAHGAEVSLQQHQPYHKCDGEKGIVIEGNCLDKKGESGAVLHV